MLDAPGMSLPDGAVVHVGGPAHLERVELDISKIQKNSEASRDS
jgi:hypothetical protein